MTSRSPGNKRKDGENLVCDAHSPAPAVRSARRPGGWRFRSLALAALAAAAIGVGWTVLHARLQQSPCGKIRNILLVSLDTCRADRLSCYGYLRRTTPNIDALAQDGVRFESALTPVPFTLPAHGSMMTGTYPPTHGVHLNNGDRLAETNVTLAEILRPAGFATAAFIGAYPLDSSFGLNQGFDTYDCQFSTKRKSSLYNERKAGDVSRAAAAWLDEHAGKPFFLFLHYYDPHFPYEPPPPFAAAFADEPYAGEVAYTDYAVGQVLDRLRSLGIYDNTLIVITGDHGESLGEHGEQTHGFFMYQSTLHVPLIVRAPGGRRGCTVSGNVSLVDIVPTVLDLAGLKAPPRMEGLTLRRLVEGAPSIPERALYCESENPATFGCSPLHGLIEGRWKYVRAPRSELYDLQSDPREQHNVIAARPGEVQHLQNRLKEMLQAMQSAAPRKGRSALTLEAMQRLQSLGYAAGGASPEPSEFDSRREDPKEFISTFNRLHQANTLFEFGRKEEAAKECRDLVAQRPGLIMAHRILGDIALEDHRTAEATQHYDRIFAILDQPGNGSAAVPAVAANFEKLSCHMSLGNAWMSEGKMEEAAAEFEAALRIEPDLLDALNNLAVARQGQGRIDEAIGGLRKSLEGNPRSPEAHNNLGLALKEQGKADEAIEQFRQALEISPNYAKAHNNLAVMLRGQGKVDDAVAHFRKALEIEPEYVDALYNLGSALKVQGKTEEAIAQFRKALQANPRYARACNDLGLALQSQGKGDEAIAQFEKAIEADARYAEAYGNLGAALYRAGKADRAMDCFRKAVEAQPNGARAHNDLGAALQGQGKMAEAEAEYRRAIELNPGYVEARGNLGGLLRHAGKVAEAIDQWREATRLNPDYGVALGRLAWALSTAPADSLRNGKEAVGLAERAARLSGGHSPEVLDVLAAAYAETGRFPEAAETAGRALTLAASQKKTPLADAIRSRKALYESGAPFREEPANAAERR